MISYDTNVLIYILEQNQQYFTAATQVLLLSEQSGCVLSSVIWQEVLVGFYAHEPSKASEIARTLHRLPATTYIAADTAIAELAAKLCAEHGRKIKGYDALHLATAIQHNCSAFYTNDKDILKIGQIEKLRLLPLTAAR